MKAKEYLSKYRKCMADLNFYEALKEQAIVDVASISSPKLDDRVQTSPTKDPICELVIELERKIARYNLEMLNCKAKMMIIENQLWTIREHNEEFYKILTYRYIMDLDWNEIAEKMFMSYGVVTHKHSPALKKFDELFGEYYAYD